MAGRIPETFIDELLTRVDIVDVIDTRVPLKKAGKDFKACCPFHEEKTPSFTVSQDKQFYHCFGCGVHGSAIGFLMEYERMSFPEAVEDLAVSVGMTVPHEAAREARQQGQVSEPLLALLQQADQYYRQQLREHPQAQEAVDYLKGRGLTGEIAVEFKLGYAPAGWDGLLQALGTDETRRQQLCDAGLAVKKDGGGYYDRFRHRIMFPIHDYRGRIVGFGGRVLGAEQPKYMNSPETPVFHKGREIYGLFRARDPIRQQQRVLVVEGYMDVVALAQFGIDYAVATLGTATTRDHLERLFRYTPQVAFCFDGDRAGREAAWRALEQALPVMHEGRQLSFLFLPEGEDPDSMVRQEGRAGFETRLGQAEPWLDYLSNTLLKQVDLKQLGGDAQLAELMHPFLNKTRSKVLQEMVLERLTGGSRIGLEKLSKLLITPEKTSYKPQTSRLRGGLKRPPTLVRQVLALVLQHPHLAQQAGNLERLRQLQLPGMALLLKLLELLKANPGLVNTGAIIERFRDDEHHGSLQKLATWEYPMRQQDVETEFQDALQGLNKAWISQSMEQLLQKKRLTGQLNKEELQQMQRLLSEKHNNQAGSKMA